jgi:N-methylhydantoinase A/oxoprolinase/acetone carboxylase beta subunit
MTPEKIVSECDLCINGTTVGLNALITHRGGKTGLICTAGHEDSIEIRNGHKEDGFRYDPEYPAARMLAPRYLRRGARERVLSTGEVRTPLHEDDVRAACEAFREHGVETIAISFVWSVLNPEHERRAAKIVREMMPGRSSPSAPNSIRRSANTPAPRPLWSTPISRRSYGNTWARWIPIFALSAPSSRCATSNRTAAWRSDGR